MLANIDRLSVAQWEADLLACRTIEAIRPADETRKALRQEFLRISQRSKAQNQSSHLGTSGVPALNEMRKPCLELMLLAHHELAAFDLAIVPTVPVDFLERLLNEIAARLTELDNCLNTISLARLTAELAGPSVAELACGRELPAKRFRPALDQLLAGDTTSDLFALTPLSALHWTEPEVAHNAVPAWFWAAAIPAARWTAALTRHSYRSTPQHREALVLAALLMDVGQIALAAAQTRGRVVSAVLYRRHREISAALISGIQGAPADASIWAGQHHERMDGSGFPRKLLRPQLSFAARTVSAVGRWTELLKSKAAANAPPDALWESAVMIWKEALAGAFDECVVRELLSTIRSDLPAAVQRAFLQGTWLKRDAAHPVLTGPHHVFSNDPTHGHRSTTTSLENQRAVP